jgi:hypothetical protein
MKHLQDFRSWFAFAGVLSIALVLMSIEGTKWTGVLVCIAIGLAVRIKYGSDVQIEQN